MRYLFSKVARARFGKVYDDLALMEDVLADSGLDWSVVRPPQLIDKPATGTYRTAYQQNLLPSESPVRAASWPKPWRGTNEASSPGYPFHPKLCGTKVSSRPALSTIGT